MHANPFGNGLCRLVGTATKPYGLYDHYFDLTRGTLRELLHKMAADNYDRRTLQAIGAKFGTSVSEFARQSIMEKIEDEIDTRDLLEAIREDDGVRYSMDEVMDIMRRAL